MTEVAAPSGKYEIKVAGSPLGTQQDSNLVRIEVDQRINAPSVFELAFRDPQMDVPPDAFTVGKTVDISLHSEAHGGTRVLMSGEITSVDQELSATGGVFTTLRGMAKGHRLFRERKSRVFVNQKASDIVRAVAGELGLTAETVDATTAVHPVTTQAGVTHWELLAALARENGMELLLDGTKLSFRKPPPAASGGPELTWGENLKELRSSVTAAGLPSNVEVRGWDPKQKRHVVGSAQPTAVGVSSSPSPRELSSGLSNAGWSATGTAYAVQGDADAAAKALGEELGSTCVELHGIAVGDALMEAGKPITLAKVGRHLDGTYVLTSVRHVYEAEGAYETEFTVSGRADRSLHGLVTGADGQARGSNGGPAIHGVAVGVVTNNNDPDNLSRVKVKYPWLSDDVESDWVRMALPMAGNGYGAMFLPEVNDEVLLAFDRGDIDRPYVVGVLYNGKDKPKYPSSKLVKSGKVLVRGLDTPSHHRLELFEQAGDKDAVLLSTGDDKFALTLDKQNTKVLVHSDGTVEIDAKQDITVATKANMKLDVTGSFEVKAREIKMTAQSGAKVDGGAGTAEVSGLNLALKGQTSGELNGGARTAVKGAIVQIN